MNICVTYYVKEIGNAFFCACNEPSDCLQTFDNCRDNLRNSQNEFLIVLQKGRKIMHYSKNERLYEIEKMMSGIPNFKERGYGSVVLQTDMRGCIEEQPPPSSYA